MTEDSPVGEVAVVAPKAGAAASADAAIAASPLAGVPPASAPTPRYQEKREAILDAAARRFNEQGVRGATLADIAGSVGLVTNSVTYYYRKKEDLATACFERSIAAYDALARSALDEPDVPQRLAAFLRAHVRLLADIDEGRHPQLVTFNDIRALPRPQTERVFALYTDMFRRVRSLLKGPASAHLARDDLNARGHIVLSTAHWMRSWMPRYEAEDYPRVADRVADVLLRGLAGPGAGWPPARPDASAATDGEPGLAEGAGWRLAGDRSGPVEAFLRAATRLVNEQGYRGASVDKISARLNVTKGSFYHHNDNKHDLISECFERSFAVMREALRRAETGPGSGWTRACAAAQALVHFQLSADGPLLRTTAVSALPDAAHRERVGTTMHRLSERYASVVVDGMMDGSIRPLDPAIASQVAIAAINAAAELDRWVPTITLDTLDALYVRPMLDGLLCAAAPGCFRAE